MFNFTKKEEERFMPTIVEQMKELNTTIIAAQALKEATVEELTGSAMKTEKELKLKIGILKEEVADLKLKKKIDEEDLAHLLKMKDEVQTLAHDRKQMEMEMQFQKDLNAAKDEHTRVLATVVEAHNKEMKVSVTDQSKQLKEMYSEILGKLPDITTSIRIRSDNKG